MKISNEISGMAGALLLTAALNCAADDQIKVYTVAKSPEIPVNTSPIRWTTPAGWDEKPGDGIHLASFVMKGNDGGKAVVAITSFPGDVGGELANVNRWRGELALAPIEAGEVTSEPATVDSFTGKLYDFKGQSARTVVADIPRNGSSWFFKLRGDLATVEAARPVFMEFLKSIHFGGGKAEAVSTTSDPQAGLNPPGAPLAQGDLPAPDAPAAGPKWNVPAYWVPTTPTSPMIYKSFSASGESNAKAVVTISFLMGEGGGTLANVNRWRGQLGLPQVDSLDGLTQTVTTADGKMTLVDFTGSDPKKRMVAAIVPQADKTWFYKLMGDSATVGSQKDSFVQFVKTVHYP